MEAPWLPTVLTMLEDIPWQCPVVKHFIMDVLVGQVLRGLPYLHLTLWLPRDMCCPDKGSLLQSVRWQWGQLMHLQWRSTSKAISAFLEPDHHKSLSHPVIFKLMHDIYLQHPPSHQHFDPWDIKHLLLFLERWAPASSITAFNLAWKITTLLVLVPGKHCSELTSLCIDNHHLWFSVMLLFSFLHLVTRWIDWVIFLLRFILILIPVSLPCILFEGLFVMYWAFLEEAGWMTCNISVLG